MARVTCYPLGNADCTLLELADERLVLVDYCDRKDRNDKKDRRADLPVELRTVLDGKSRDSFDVVAFSHADDDHVAKAEEFFWLEHAEKYQGDDRIKIEELWVPACFILEQGVEESAKIIRQEARHRLKEGKGIRVFGNPGSLDDWLKKEDIEPKEREAFITHAGALVPGFDSNPTEVFVHSPFSYKMDDEEVDRNGNCLVLHVTFSEGDSQTRLMLGADAPKDAWEGIIIKTEKKGRDERLGWDIFRVSHHCSYKSLADDKGKDTTKPTEKIASMFSRGEANCYIISSSDTIPTEDTDQPPHRQAAAYYGEVAGDKVGDFLVTMREPKPSEPAPLVIEITKAGPSWKKATGLASGISTIISRPSPEQG